MGLFLTAFPFVELHKVSDFLSAHFSSLWRSLWIAAQVWCVSHSSQYCIISTLSEGRLYPIIQSSTKTSKRIRLSVDPWSTPLVIGLPLDFVSLNPSVQSVSNPLHCLLIQPILHQCLYENLVGDSAKSTTEVNVEQHPLLSSHLPH